MRTIKEKLRQMDRSEEINRERIGEFVGNFRSDAQSHRLERLDWIENHTRAKAGCEGMREKIIARYRAELEATVQA